MIGAVMGGFGPMRADRIGQASDSLLKFYD
jgi:hypothetical protein